jgi:hypothetical protein
MSGKGPSGRREPRLWVEKVWILESIEATEAIREIDLRLGLNLVLSPPGDGSTGHGVGKTAFGQLVRFALEDPHWAAGSPLRDELLEHMPDGAVAARVHVAGEAWTVLKPWKHQKQYRAGRSANWQQLARSEVPNHHEEYAEALEASLVRSLPVLRLPGSNQPIQWHHVLAWCSRDQGSRYQSYYHWRVEGAGFSLPAQSPAVLVRVVLGLLKDASLLDRLKKVESDLQRAKADLERTQRRPDDLLAHVKHQLAVALDAPESSPFRATSLFDGSTLVALARQRHEGYVRELSEVRAKQEKLESQRTQVLDQRSPLSLRVTLLRNHIKQIEAALVGNRDEVERLRREPQALQQMLPRFCGPGHRLYEDCHYVTDRIKTMSFETQQTVAQRKQWEEEQGRQLAQEQGRLRAWEQELEPIERALSTLKEETATTAKREAQLLADQRRLGELLREYELYEGILAGRDKWPELVGKQATVDELSRQLGDINLKVEAEKTQFAVRRRAIHDLMDEIAKRLPGFEWGVFDESGHPPFRIGPMHSTTFGILETLAGDIACLLDSSNPDSFHPGFLLHDSPREAEMSEPVLWSLLSAVNDVRNPPFQHIVTTSTAHAKGFEPYVRLALHSRADDGYLFRRKIGLESKPLL